MNQKDAELLNPPLLPDVPQFDNADTDDTGCSDRLWLVCARCICMNQTGKAAF